MRPLGLLAAKPRLATCLRLAPELVYFQMKAKGMVPMNNEIRKGDRVVIKPAWRDKDDDKFIWVAVSGVEKGRLDISPINTGLRIWPVQTVTLDMVERDQTTDGAPESRSE